MGEKSKLLLSTMLATLVSAMFWFAVWNLAYGLTGGDYRPGSVAPTENERRLRLWAILAAGFVIHAAIMWLWRDWDFRIRRRGIG